MYRSSSLYENIIFDIEFMLLPFLFKTQMGLTFEKHLLSKILLVRNFDAEKHIYFIGYSKLLSYYYYFS